LISPKWSASGQGPGDRSKIGAFPLRLLSGHSKRRPQQPLVALGQKLLCHSTRRQELADDEAIKEGQKRLLLRQEMKKHNKHLASAANKREWSGPWTMRFSWTTAIAASTADWPGGNVHERKAAQTKRQILDRMGSSELAAICSRHTNRGKTPA